MTLTEAGEIFAYWAESPPAHLMVQFIARALGWRPPPALATDADMGSMAAASPGFAVVANAKIDLPDAMFDVCALRERNRVRAAEIALRNASNATSEADTDSVCLPDGATSR